MINAFLLIVVIAELLLAVFVWVQDKKSPINITFAVFSIAIAQWTFGLFMLVTAKDLYTLNLWGRLCYVGPIFLPAVILYFVRIFPEKINTQLTNDVKIALLLSFTILILNYFGLITSDYTSASTYKNKPFSYILFAPYFLGFSLWSLYLLRKKSKIFSAKYRNQINNVYFGILLSLIIGVIFSLVLPLSGYANLNFIGPVVGGPIFIYAIGYAIVKYELMDIKIRVTKTAAFIAIYTIVLGIPFMVGYHKSWLVATVLMFIFATFGPLIYRMLEQKALYSILEQENNYRKILLDISKGMVEITDLNKLMKYIIYLVKRTIDLEFAAIFVENEKDKAFKLEVARNKSSLYFSTYQFSDDHPLISYMMQIKKPFTTEQIDQEMIYSLAFTSCKIGLVVPAYIEKKLVAFLVLGAKNNNAPFTIDDTRIFEILSRQVALSVVNCKFIQEFKKTNERIFAAEKLASIGGMTSGIIHQIGNRLTQFVLTLREQKSITQKLINDYSSDKAIKEQLELLDGFTTIIDENVKMISDMTYGILNFTRARADRSSNQFSFFSFKDLVELVIMPLKTKHDMHGEFPLKLNLPQSDIIYAIKMQIMESLLNVIDNAYESCEEKLQEMPESELKNQYSPLIEVTLKNLQGISRIEIKDNGKGISEDAAIKIFSPFFTTKNSSGKSGTGIGMYVVKRMIEESLQGKIWFESQPGIGTTFIIEIPSKDIA